MYLIFDSNIWISELGLNSAKGAAVRFFVKNKGATVVVPEVVRLETERHLKAVLTQCVEEIGKNYRQLLAVFGKLKELVLPNAQAIEEKAAAVFNKCKVEILECPLTLESAKNSFLRTVDKVPPSSANDQQFKDGVIWTECMRLLEIADVYLVTADKAFYQGRQYKNGLAEVLVCEARNNRHKIHVFPTLSELLSTIKTKVSIDERALVSQFWENNRHSIESILERNAFAIAGDPRVAVDLYATEDPNRLYAEFRISCQCEDLTSDGRYSATLVLKGDCTYMVGEKQFSALRNYGEELSFKTKDGVEKSLRNVVIFADALEIGHRTVEYPVKYKLDD